MVPEGWEVKSIADIAKVTSGGTPSRSSPSYWGGDIPWITTTEVQNCNIYKSDVREYITQEGLSKSSAKLVPRDTILLAMIEQGKTRGQVALLTFQAVTNQNCAAIILNDGNDPLFVSEGESSAKMAKIRHNAYLQHSFKSFHSVMDQRNQALFIFGHSLAENDTHILNQIGYGKCAKVYISLHGDPDTEDNRGIIQRAEAIAGPAPAQLSDGS